MSMTTRQVPKGIGLWLPVWVVVAVGPAVLADTLHVPGEYPTIQGAIDASVDGDVVEIADGTYAGAGNRNLNIGGKRITVRSASGDPALCIIDCERAGRGFYFGSGEGRDSIVDGLTITNGSASSGGAVYCGGASAGLSASGFRVAWPATIPKWGR